MSYSAALEEAYASGGEDEATVTVAKLDHPAFPAPAYVLMAMDGVAFDIGSTVAFKDPHGTVILAQPCAFKFTRPGADKDGPTDGKVRIDNVNRKLEPLLRAAMGSGEAVTMEFYEYLVAAPIPAITTDFTSQGPPDGVIDGLTVDLVNLSETSAEGTVRFVDGRQTNVPTGPNAFFDRDNFPALFSS